jgi:NADPH:quinone reductase-like Zn-dependent oxidoreductase
MGFVSFKPPLVHRALVQDAEGRPVIVDNAPVPALGPGDILIKTTMVAINPCDYKMPAAFPTKGAVIGNDFVGSVVAMHPVVSRPDMKLGDTVCGLVHGSNPADLTTGAFAEYVRAPADLVLRVPNGFKTEDAAALGSALTTATVSLWEGGLELPISPDDPANADDPVPVLVFGASTATGTMALQLLSLSGASPIVATCSPRNFDLVKSYGATSVHDYVDPATPGLIKAETGGDLAHALDIITDKASVACCSAALSRFGGRLTCLEYCPEEMRTRKAVEVEFPLALEVFGKKLELSKGYGRPASELKRQAAIKWFKMFQRLLDDGSIRAHPVKVLSPGFENIIEGVKLLKSGVVSGYKLVVPLA